MKCERCGSEGATESILQWEATAEQPNPPPRRLCGICADVLCNEYLAANPIDPEQVIDCPGCGMSIKRNEMKLLAKEHGGCGLCPRCHARGLLPWEVPEPQNAN